MVLTTSTIVVRFGGGERVGSQAACSVFILSDCTKAGGPQRFWRGYGQVGIAAGSDDTPVSSREINE